METETLASLSFLDLLIGGLIVAAVMLKATFERLAVPSLVGFILLGLIVGTVDREWRILTESGTLILGFMASMGIIMILFRVGLESNLHELVDKFPAAAPVWIGNVGLSAALGFAATHYLLDQPVLTGLIVAIALSATSVAVSLDVWRELGLLQSADGELLTDVAGLDDITAVALMALLLAVVPALEQGNDGALVGLIAETGFLFAFKTSLFGLGCLIFARYASGPIMKRLHGLAAPDPILVIAGFGIMIAALASQLGFSLAIGALFAGLVFSRDTDAVHMSSLFLPIHALFAPFFFIGVGLSIDLESLAAASIAGGILLVAAVGGKIIGAGLPVLRFADRASALAVGLSMVPRAEIALLVMLEGQRVAAWAVPNDIYAAMIIVSVVTCLIAPIAVRRLLTRRDSL